MYTKNEKERKVVFYGRVSTEHEAQLSALENQMQWYDDQLQRNPNWILVDKYIDRGITGTLAKKRPSFMKMIEDAKKGGFDLIVTREVCRFARNTVDTLEYTRMLAKIGVEIFFVEDNIWTFNSDGELRLTIMAALAQEESRKDSERVKAGQKISRDNGVLFGNGNILGYDLYRNIDSDGKWDSRENTYVINPEQAETVKIIYDLYYDGLGLTKICRELCRMQRKDAFGQVSWSPSKVHRIIHNMTYAGYKGYLKSYTDNYLEHTRVQNRDRDSYMYVKGDWEPIIPEERWLEVQAICKEKSTEVKKPDSGNRKIVGKNKSSDVWLRKLECRCGSSFRKNKWRTNKKTSTKVYGYQCYNQVNNGSIKTREKYGLDTDGYCDIPMIADWKLKFMAKHIFEALWTDRQESVYEAIKLIKENYTEDTKVKSNQLQISNLESSIRKSEARLKQLIEMRMDNEITKEEYAEMRDSLEQTIKECKSQLETNNENEIATDNIDYKLKEIEETLDRIIDFTTSEIDSDIIDKLVVKIIPEQKEKFKWILNLTGENNPLYTSVSGRKGKAEFECDFQKDLPLFLDCSGSYQGLIFNKTIKSVTRKGSRFFVFIILIPVANSNIQ